MSLISFIYLNLSVLPRSWCKISETVKDAAWDFVGRCICVITSLIQILKFFIWFLMELIFQFSVGVFSCQTNHCHYRIVYYSIETIIYIYFFQKVVHIKYEIIYIMIFIQEFYAHTVQLSWLIIVRYFIVCLALSSVLWRNLCNWHFIQFLLYRK